MIKPIPRPEYDKRLQRIEDPLVREVVQKELDCWFDLHVTPTNQELETQAKQLNLAINALKELGNFILLSTDQFPQVREKIEFAKETVQQIKTQNMDSPQDEKAI